MPRSLSGHCEQCGADVGELCKEGCPNTFSKSDPVALTNERKKQHGNWAHQAHVARNLKGIIDEHARNLSNGQREALDMIAVKISRILSGDPNHADHWDDIAGYAYLGKGGHGQ
jgi:hypothetical protein